MQKELFYEPEFLQVGKGDDTCVEFTMDNLQKYIAENDKKLIIGLKKHHILNESMKNFYLNKNDEIEMLQNDGLNLKKIPRKKQNKVLAMIALNQNVESYEFISSKLFDREIIELILKNQPSLKNDNINKLKKLCNRFVEFADKSFINAEDIHAIYKLNEEFFNKAVELNGKIISLIPTEYLTEELIIKAVKENPYSLILIDNSIINENIILKTIQYGASMFRYIVNSRLLNQNINTKKIYMQAVMSEWENIRYIEKDKLTEEICIEAIKQNKMAINFIDSEILNKLNLKDYCFNFTNVEEFLFEDEKLQKLSIVKNRNEHMYVNNILINKILDSKLCTTLIVNSEIEFEIFKKLALSNNYIAIIENENIKDEYKILSNYFITKNEIKKQIDN